MSDRVVAFYQCLRKSLTDAFLKASEDQRGEKKGNYHNPTRQRGIFGNTLETQKLNPSLTLRVVMDANKLYSDEDQRHPWGNSFPAVSTSGSEISTDLCREKCTLFTSVTTHFYRLSTMPGASGVESGLLNLSASDIREIV